MKKFILLFILINLSYQNYFDPIKNGFKNCIKNNF